MNKKLSLLLFLTLMLGILSTAWAAIPVPPNRISQNSMPEQIPPYSSVANQTRFTPGESGSVTVNSPNSLDGATAQMWGFYYNGGWVNTVYGSGVFSGGVATINYTIPTDYVSDFSWEIDVDYSPTSNDTSCLTYVNGFWGQFETYDPNGTTINMKAYTFDQYNIFSTSASYRVSAQSGTVFPDPDLSGSVVDVLRPWTGTWDDYLNNNLGYQHYPKTGLYPTYAMNKGYSIELLDTHPTYTDYQKVRLYKDDIGYSVELFGYKNTSGSDPLGYIWWCTLVPDQNLDVTYDGNTGIFSGTFDTPLDLNTMYFIDPWVYEYLDDTWQRYYYISTGGGTDLLLSGARPPAPVNNITLGLGYNTIQAAIDAASAGNVIEISTGTYNENLTIPVSVTLVGEVTRAIPTLMSTTTPAITVTADNVTIQNLIVTKDVSLVEGIRVASGATTGLTLDNVLFPNLGNGTGNAYGVNIATSFNGLDISNCQFTAVSSATRAIGIYAAKNFTLTDYSTAESSFTYLFVGIYLSSSIDGYDIYDNIFGPVEPADCTAAVSGIYFGDGAAVFDIENINIYNNQFTDFGRGVYFWNYGSGIIGAVNIYDNNFENSIWSSPIRMISYLSSTQKSTLEGPIIIDGNTFLQEDPIVGGAGVSMIDMRAGIESATSQITITDNDITFVGPFTESTYGMLFRGPLTNIDIAGNVIDGNLAGGASTGLPATSGIVFYTNASGFGPISSSADINIDGNSIVELGNGVALYDMVGAVYGNLPTGVDLDITDNTLTGNTIYDIYSGGGEYTNASPNYWGDSYPLDDVTGNVTTIPWWTDAAMTILGYPPVHNVNLDTWYFTIQAAINAASNGHVIEVSAGTYNEDVYINKTLTVRGADAATTIISGPMGGNNQTVFINANNVLFEKFTVTRDGNNPTDWYNSTLNSTGLQVQNGYTGSIIQNCIFTGNRNALYFNNTQGHTIQNNIIDFNRTGLQFVNNVSNCVVQNNQITNNWTLGVLIYHQSAGQPASNNVHVTDNNISGNWYSQVECKIVQANPTVSYDFARNWYGSAVLNRTSSLAGEPGYDLPNPFPAAYGGTATNPGGNEGKISGQEYYKIVYYPWYAEAAMENLLWPPVHNVTQNTYFDTIQAAIDAAVANDVIEVAAGTYAENIVVDVSVTINGAGQGQTIVIPAVSAPGVVDGPSYSGSQVVVVSAHNVTISNLTIDGNNPLISSGITVNGIDIDARNGIIESDGPWNNLHVVNVTVQNIFLRGIYTRSGGTGFHIEHNTVQNVAGGYSSIAIFNWLGTGIIEYNNVTQANDAISSNHSRGIQILYNTITNSGSGIHTDNNGSSGGVADIIAYNNVSNSPSGGYGIWTFFNYLDIQVHDNTVTNVDIGLFHWGGPATPGTVSYINNTVNCQNIANAIGMYLTTGDDAWGSWMGNASLNLSGNVISNASYGLILEYEAGYSMTVTAGTGNVWGGSVDNIAVCGLGTLTSSGLAGALVDVWHPGKIQDGIKVAATSGTVNVMAGTYNEHVNVNKAVSVLGPEARVLPIIDGGGTGTVVTISSNGAILDGFQVQNSGNGTGDAGVMIYGASNCTVQNNTVISNANGIGVAMGSGNLVKANQVNNNLYYGIAAIASIGNTIEINNVNTNGLDAIALDNASALGGSVANGSTGNYIKGNTIASSRDGVFIGESCNGNFVTDGNVITATSIGISVWRPSGQTITGNTISNALTGIRLLGSSNNTITYNTITGNSVGIQADPSWQVGVWYQCTNNYLFKNKIAGNTVGVDADDANNAGNWIDATQNWWGHASGPYDANLLTPPENAYGQGDEVTHFVLYEPWYADEAMTVLSSDAPVHNVTKNTYYWTIQAAINDAITTNGDHITVAAGTYNLSGMGGSVWEPVSVTKSLTITGAGSGTTILDANGSSDQCDVMAIRASNVTIEGFTIKNGTYGLRIPGYNYGSSLSNLSFTDVKVDYNRSSGVVFDGAGTVTGVGFSDCSFSHNGGRGLYTAPGKVVNDIALTECVASYNVNSGVHLQGTQTNVTITGGEFSYNKGVASPAAYGSGIWLEYTTGAEINGVTAIGNGSIYPSHGIYVRSNSSQVDITDCEISSSLYGILYLSVTADASNDATSNTISNCTYGLADFHGKGNTHTQNEISNCANGIYLGGTLGVLVIEYNILNDNPIQVKNISTLGVPLDMNAVLANNTYDSAFLVGQIIYSNPVINISRGTTYSTIQAAIDDAVTQAGDVIQVAPGTYNEAIIVSKGVTIESIGTAAETIIQTPAGSLTTAIKILGNLGSVTIDGFTVQGWTESGIVQGMAAAAGTESHILNNMVVSNGTYMRNGIQVSGNGSEVIGNTVIGATLTEDWAGTCITVVNGSDILVSGNTVSGGDNGIGIINYSATTPVSGVTIDDNDISDVNWGISMQGNYWTQPWSNYVLDDIAITNNDIYDNLYTGIEAYWCTLTNLSVTGNNLTNNPIHFDNGSETTLTEAQMQAILTGNTYDSSYLVDQVIYSGPVINLTQMISYNTIQAAVLAAASNDHIYVTPGEYVEVGQIVINKNLTIEGADKLTTIVKPAQNTGSSGDARGWWLVQSGFVFNLSNLTLDGAGYNIMQGIRTFGTGTIDNNIIKNISYPGYNGLSISMFNNMTISNNSFSNIGRVGVIAYGTGVTNGLISDNTYTGKGVGDWLDYGVEVGGGAVVSISGNEFTNCYGVALSDGSVSAGILVTSYYGGGSTATVTNNNIHDNSYGMVIGYNGSDTSVVTATGNTFTNNPCHIRVVKDGLMNLYTAMANNTYDKKVLRLTGDPQYAKGIYSSIQYAIDVSVEGDIIEPQPDTYIEQLHVTTNNLTVRGVDGNTDAVIIQSPNTLPLLYNTNNKAIVFVEGVADFTLSDVTVDGADKGNANYRFQGIGFWNAGGLVEDVDVINIMDSPFSGAQHGVGIYAYNNTPDTDYSIALNRVNVTDFQKNALALIGNGDNLTVDLDFVVTIGQGPTSVTAQNGIQISDAHGTVDNCTIEDIAWIYPGYGDYWTATGFLIDGCSSILADNVNIDNCQTSVYWIDSDGTYQNSAITNPQMDAIYGYATSGTHTFVVNNVSITGTNTPDSWGIGAFALTGATINMTVQNSDISNYDWGIVPYYYGGTVNMSITGNTLDDNNYAIVNYNTVGSLTITGNYFGYNPIQVDDSYGSVLDLNAIVTDNDNEWESQFIYGDIIYYRGFAIDLVTGWNLISSPIVPEDLDMEAVLAPLIDGGYLIKAQDEAGNALIYNNGWINNMPDFAMTEGYYVQVNADCTLPIFGNPVSLPMTINLNSGWNIISFPYMTPQTAMTILQPLIDDNKLVKVQDDTGGSILYNGVFWMDTIGNFETGEGYYVKVNASTSITYGSPSKGRNLKQDKSLDGRSESKNTNSVRNIKPSIFN